MIRFEDRVAIVTGAGQGIGRAYAEVLAARGARVVVNNRGRGSGGAAGPAEAVAAAIRAGGGQAVANDESVEAEGAGERMVQQALDTYGRLDILICNAGVAEAGVLHRQNDADLRRLVEINVLGSLAVMRAALRPMRRDRYGRILLTTSGAGLSGRLGYAAYGASKSAMHGLAASATLEADRYGVRVNVISPQAHTRLNPGTPTTDLPLASVAQVAAYMVSSDFEGRGEVWSVAGGQVRVVRLLATRGVSLDPAALTAERIADLAPAIRDLSGAVVVPPPGDAG